MPEFPDPVPDEPFKFAVPIAPRSKWETAVSAGGVAVADSATDLHKPHLVTDSSRIIISRPDHLAGTTLRVRLKYRDLETPPDPSLRIRIYGRYSSEHAWSAVRNAANEAWADIRMEPAIDTNDGSFSYTTPDNTENAWDCDGYNEFLFLVEVALDTGDAGDDDDAVLEAKIV